jgi:hypothetical protein
LRKAGPREKDCDTFENGNIAFCISHYLMKNCPKPVQDDDCKATAVFMECVEKSNSNKE